VDAVAVNLVFPFFINLFEFLKRVRKKKIGLSLRSGLFCVDSEQVDVFTHRWRELKGSLGVSTVFRH
jgi:hypothetical protein